MGDTVEGRAGIKVTLLKHSISDDGKQIATFECEYHRYFHQELLTHRLFSRNAASSRAIPIKKAIQQVRNNPAMPFYWGKNKKGMQSDEELVGIRRSVAQFLWNIGGYCAAGIASLMGKVGVHKQFANRLIEPFQMIKVVITATSYDNFFHLRNHKAAQPEFQELARLMYETLKGSKPIFLNKGEWHLPYVHSERDSNAKLRYYSFVTIGDRTSKVELTLEEALRLSASLCAQVSYRKSDESLEKASDMYDILVGMKPCHASPWEHQATPIGYVELHNSEWEWEDVKGITHVDKYNNYWSGNLCGWIQYRQLLDGNTCWDYEKEISEQF